MGRTGRRARATLGPEVAREKVVSGPRMRLDRAMPPDFSRFRAPALAALAVLAPLLGGSTEEWSRGALCVATAAVLLAWPPRRAPGALWTGLALALVTLAGAAFLPARWFPLPVWRQVLTAGFEVPLAGTRTPQPWLTLEGAGLFLAGLSFAAAVVAHRWSREERRAAVRTYALGMLLLAGLAVGAVLAKWHVPWWPQPLNSTLDFGFFPNRNQTANVLALGGIMTAALGFDALGDRRRSGYGWFASLALLAVALVAAYSRAGIALFFGGTAGWLLIALRAPGSKKGAMLGLAGVLVLLAAFLLFGGETLQRFQRRGDGPTADFRVEIQHDAWRLAQVQPGLGSGLGTFEPLFALARAESIRQNRARHPESDWLWAAVELGWPAVALLGVALGWWFRETLPFDAGSDRALRSAAAVCGLGFAVHGLIDVSGHRPGALWPALLLYGLARHPRRAGVERAGVAPVFRAGAVVIAGFGLRWVAAAAWPERMERWPTSGTLAWREELMGRANSAGDYPAVITQAEAALRIAPLKWNLYYDRAVARAAAPGGTQAAVDDFDRARFLEPQWVELCLSEGRVWLALDEPALTLDAWSEALRRAGPEAAGLFPQLLAAGWKKLAVRAGLAGLAQTNADYLVAYLEYASGLDFDVEANRLLERDPELRTLSAAQRRRLLDAWFRRGDRDAWLGLLMAHPEWQEDAWLGLAHHCAQRQNFERAWQFVRRYGPVPVLPQIVSGKSLAELERGFHFHPEDLQEGLAFFTALRQQRQLDEALATLQAVDRLPGRPDYVPWLEAELWAEKREWAKAWEAWQRYYAGRR
jgi:O-antigen ligase